MCHRVCARSGARLYPLAHGDLGNGRTRMIKEKVVKPVSGWLPLCICILSMLGGIAMVVTGIARLEDHQALGLLLVFAGPVAISVSSLMMFGFQAVQPNAARVLLLFGEYRGSITESGFYFVNPFYSRAQL